MAKYNSLTLEARAIYTFADSVPGTPDLEEDFEFDACYVGDYGSLLADAVGALEKLWDGDNYGEFNEDNVSVEITSYKDVPNIYANETDVWEYVTVWERFNYSQEILNAGIQAGISIDDVEEAYAGTFDNDEDFARDLAEQLGAVDKDAKWPMNCIDWEYAAKELMYEYTEGQGHYFRNF